MQTLRINNLIPLTKDIPIPYSQAIRRSKISFQDVYDDLVRKDINVVDEPFQKEGGVKERVYIGWDRAVIADSSIALATGELGACADLKVIDPTSSNLQFQMHVTTNGVSADYIKEILIKASSLGIHLEDSEIEIMPGLTLHPDPPNRILEALYRINPSLIDKVTLIRDPVLHEGHKYQAVLTHEGKTFRAPPSDEMENWHKCWWHGPCTQTLSKKGHECINRF